MCDMRRRMHVAARWGCYATCVVLHDKKPCHHMSQLTMSKCIHACNSTCTYTAVRVVEQSAAGRE
jgi:hypothetical protein